MPNPGAQVEILVGGVPVSDANPLPTGGGGGAVTVANGADVNAGATTDAAVTTDAVGSQSGKLRGLVKILADVWDSVLRRLVVVSKYTGAHIATNTTTTVKSGAGVLHSITINTRGPASNVTVYDNTAGSGTVLAVIDTTLSTTAFLFDISFSTGCTLVTAGTGPADLSVSYL